VINEETNLKTEEVARAACGAHQSCRQRGESHLIRDCNRCRESFSLRGKRRRNVFVRNSICVVSSISGRFGQHPDSGRLAE